MPSRDLLVAVDIGGTFTDVTVQDAATGQAWTAKTPSTPRDPSEGFITGVTPGAGRGRARRGGGRPRAARHHRRHEHDPGRPHRAHRAADDARLSPCAGDRPCRPAAARQSLGLGEAEAAGAALAWSSKRRAASAPMARNCRRSTRTTSARPRAPRRPPVSRRSPSASCTPSPTRRMNAARWRSLPRKCPSSRAPPRSMCCPWCANTSAAWPRC